MRECTIAVAQGFFFFFSFFVFFFSTRVHIYMQLFYLRHSGIYDISLSYVHIHVGEMRLSRDTHVHTCYKPPPYHGAHHARLANAVGVVPLPKKKKIKKEIIGGDGGGNGGGGGQGMGGKGR